MIDWQEIAEVHGYKNVKQMFLAEYAQTNEQRKNGKLSIKGLARLLNISNRTIERKLKELNIPMAGLGGPNFKNTIIDPSKFGFETEEQLLRYWREQENKNIREIYNAVIKNFGHMSWHWFRIKLRKLGIVEKDIHWNQDYKE